MSKKSSTIKQVHKSKEQIIAEQKHKAELDRQKEVVNKQLLPALQGIATNITDAKAILNQAVETLRESFREELMKEQKRLSEGTVSDLKIVAKDHNKRAVKLLEALNGQRVGLVEALLGTMNVLTEAAETKKNQGQLFKDLEIKF